MPEKGYQEFAHTADWGLHVWAGDLVALLCTAAEGMFALLDIEAEPRNQRSVMVEIPAKGSLEVFLVDFLNELLYLSERDQILFDQFDLILDDSLLKGMASGGNILSQSIEIKAVTFHNLEVIENERGFEARIIFDV